MSEPIKIVVTAQTAEAAAALQAFVQNAGKGLKALAPAAEHTGEALQKLRETSLLAREGMHSLELGAMTLAGTKLPELAEAVMGVRLALNGTRTVAKLFELSLSEMLLPIVAIAGAVTAGYLLWEGYGDHMESAETKAKNLAAALEKLPELLKQISAAESGGLVAEAQAQKWKKLLSGEIPLYRNTGALGGEDLTTDGTIRNTRTGVVIGQRDQATQAEKQAFVEKQMLAAQLNKTQIDAAEELKRLHDEDAAAALAGVQKQIATENDRYQKELAHIQDLHQTAIAAGGKDNSDAAAEALARHNATIEEINQKAALTQATAEKKAQAELDKLALGWQKDIEAFMKRNVETEKQISEEKKKQLADAEKLAQVTQELARSAAQVELKKIQDNPFLTNYEKGQDSIPAIKSLMAANQTDISSQTQIAANSGSDDAGQIARTQALTKINELMLQQVELQHQLNAAENQDSFSYQIGEVIIKLQNIGTIAQQSAAAFSAVWQVATDSISKNISGLIMGTETWGQALKSIYNSIVTEFVNQMVHMVVEWMMQHTIMAGISAAWHALQTGQQAAATSAQVGIHTAGETAKTGATAAGAGARGGIGVMETLWHGIQTGLKVAIHAVGQGLMTAASLVGALIRHAYAFLEMQPFIVLAGIEAAAAVAGIPIVGPVLAPIAAATTIAGLEALAAFANGGRPEVGELALVGERGPELFVPDTAGTILTASHTASLLSNSGRPVASPAAGGGGGGDSKGVSVYAFTDPRQMADHLQKNDSHEKWVVDVMSRNMHKFR